MMDSWEEEFWIRTIVYGEKLASEQMERAYELSHLDYQALIVVASMQQEFEKWGILDYKRTETPGLSDSKYYQRIWPGWMLAADPPHPSTPEPATETLEVTRFQYQKRLKHLWGAWWSIAVYPIYLAVSHGGREVLYEMKPMSKIETVLYETKDGI